MSGIICRRLVMKFGEREVLADLSLDLPDTGITAVIGPNGAGKTTLVNVITGFLRPDRGSCAFAGAELTRLPAHTIVAKGIVRTFQELRLIRNLSVLDNVVLARQGQRGEGLVGALLRFGVARQEKNNRSVAYEILARVGLDSQAAYLAGELSYGQQKLLTIACCLATESSILLLDEPVSGLDPATIPVVMGLLQKIIREGKGVIFIEHNMDVVADFANTLIVMDRGRVIAQGSPRIILNQERILEAYIG